jgi:type I restriction enzyme S subunit
MEVKPSYKQTEVGEIPKEWEAKTLSSLTTLLTNGFVGTATSAYVESEDGVLYIQGYNVKENGFNFHGIKRVSRAFHARNQKSCLQPGDLLTIQTGDIGITTVVPPELAGANCHALIISRLNKRASEPGFYCHYFNSERGRIAFKEIETGSTMKHLNCGDVKRLILPSPPIEEQRAIATALGDADALLRGLDALIAKKRDLKQAAMQQLLTGQMRLPGFQGEWEVKRLEHLADIFSGSTPKTTEPSFWDGGVKWCTPTDITSCPGKFLLETERTISSLGLASCAARLLPAGSLLLCSEQPLEKSESQAVKFAPIRDSSRSFAEKGSITNFSTTNFSR